MVSSNPAPKRSLTKLLVLWNVALSVLVLVGMALYASAAQAANDPPVRVYSANSDDVGGGGTGGTADNTIDGTAPDQLRIVTTSNLSANHPHVCIVTASASAKYAGNGTYIFGLSMDNAGATVSSSDRRIEMFDNGGINDDSYEEVSTVYVFNDVMGSHDFRFSARKSAAGNGSLVVDASSMSVVCLKKNLTGGTLQTAEEE